MPLDKDLYRIAFGENLDDIKCPTTDSILAEWKKEQSSKYPLITLGDIADGKFLLTEEERSAHLHILGAPNEGKSKFIELLMRHDIDAGYGCCILDPTVGGKTAYAILRYCASIGKENVLLIDPTLRYGLKREEGGRGFTVCGINPITNAPAEVTAEKLMDISRILWDESEQRTANIETYLRAIVKVLASYKAEPLTLAEMRFFEHFAGNTQRYQILSALRPQDRNRQILEEAFADKNLYKTEYRSTFKRLQPFLQETLTLMLGTQKAIDFQKVISEGWVLIVNLSPLSIWGRKHSRLLGTIILNELIHSINHLQNFYEVKPYYMYIDEVGEFATPKLQWLLDYGRHLNLRLTLGHQGLGQIVDKSVRDSIMRSAKHKVVFHTASDDDQRIMMSHIFHSGMERQAKVANRKLRQGQAIIALDKEDPVVLNVEKIPTDDLDITNEELDEYIFNTIYTQECYSTPQEIKQEINARFTKPGGGDFGRPEDNNLMDTPGGPSKGDSTSASKGPSPGQTGKSAKSYFAKRKTKKDI